MRNLSETSVVTITGNEFSSFFFNVEASRVYSCTQTYYTTNAGRVTVVEGDFLIKKGSFWWPVKRD